MLMVDQMIEEERAKHGKERKTDERF